MANKQVVITGATSGIGREVASQLAAQGASLALLARDVAKGEAVAAELAQQTGRDKPLVFACDQSRADSIRACGEAVRAKLDRIDVLINNAGLFTGTRTETPDGIELVFATNVLGYHHVTQELLPLLERAGGARIVNVASDFAGGLDLDDLEFKRRPFGDIKVYQQTKQANRMWTWALARRLKDKKITANAMAPGMISTGLYRNVTGFKKLMVRLALMTSGRSPAKGADTVTWLALSPDVEGRTSLFWRDRKEIACKFRGEKDEERLWAICEEYAARRNRAAAA